MRDIGIEANARVADDEEEEEEKEEKNRKSRKRWDELFACDVRKLKAEDELRRMFMGQESVECSRRRVEGSGSSIAVVASSPDRRADGRTSRERLVWHVKKTKIWRRSLEAILPTRRTRATVKYGSIIVFDWSRVRRRERVV